MVSSKYTEKCIRQTEQFTKLRHNPTKSIEHKIQRELRKLKTRLTIQEHCQLYPTVSNPCRFYGTAKLHELPPDGTIEDLPIRPIVSNIGTASYRLAEHLAQNLSPLGQSTYSIKNTFDLMRKIRYEQIPLGFTMVSFDVKSLFTSVQLTEPIDIILDRVYNGKEISTVLTKNEMKKLLTLCTKGLHFTLNNEIYVQNDGVAMRFRLGPILANVLMVELENTLIPRLHQHIKIWRRYVDDTFAYVKNESIDYVLTTLNSFHPNIGFTYEKENNSQLPFLNVLFIRNGTHLDTAVYRKDTHNDLYLHWDAFAPVSWKRGTLRTLINRAYLICSNKELLQKELVNLRSVYLKKSGYPLSTIKQLMQEIEESPKQKEVTQVSMMDQPNPQEQKVHSLLLPFAGSKGTILVKNLNKTLKNVLPS